MNKKYCRYLNSLQNEPNMSNHNKLIIVKISHCKWYF